MVMPSLNGNCNSITIVLYGSLPVEYLQLWKGFFAEYTSPEGEALLLSVKVGVQGTILRRGAMHL